VLQAQRWDLLQAQRWENVALSPVLLHWETAAIRLSYMVGHTILPGDFGVFFIFDFDTYPNYS